MSITEIKGNIFTTNAQTIVNTVNCVGVMGAGIALEFRLREPEMYRRYVTLCEEGKLRPGILWLYKSGERMILNFPTKDDWRHPSRPEYLEKGLEKFAASYREKGITSIAFPLLGSQKGGLPANLSRQIMLRHLAPLTDLEVEIYEYDPKAHDDLYDQIRSLVLAGNIQELARATGITKSRLETISRAMQHDDICQLSQVGALPGVGPGTLEKLFALRGRSGAGPDQPSLLER